jgi:hypothetical protein
MPSRGGLSVPHECGPSGLAVVHPTRSSVDTKQRIPAYSSLFPLIPAYFGRFEPSFQLIPGYSSLFQPIPAYSSLFPDKKIFLMNGEVTIQSARREEPPLLHVGEGIYKRNTGVSDRRWFYVDLCGLPGRKTCISNHVNPLKTT